MWANVIACHAEAAELEDSRKWQLIMLIVCLCCRKKIGLIIIFLILYLSR